MADGPALERGRLPTAPKQGSSPEPLLLPGKEDGPLPDFADQYSAKINEYVTNGFARPLSEEEAASESPSTWYLPHFAVWNPNKPGKLRLVFDAAAKAHGSSLNDPLLPGPDLLNLLVSVLYKFDQRRVAFRGDIRSMFHMVKIQEEDQSAQRFLWVGWIAPVHRQSTR